jgi:hypothetical protein
MTYPEINISPCEELEIVVDDLYTKHRAGTLAKFMTPAFRADLETLKGLCPAEKRSAQTAQRLGEIERALKGED